MGSGGALAADKAGVGIQNPVCFFTNRAWVQNQARNFKRLKSETMNAAEISRSQEKPNFLQAVISTRQTNHLFKGLLRFHSACRTYYARLLALTPFSYPSFQEQRELVQIHTQLQCRSSGFRMKPRFLLKTLGLDQNSEDVCFSLTSH